MKTIGFIGGMSWESTVTYYRVVNEAVKDMLGGLHSAKCILYSVDFHEIEEYQAAGQWEKSGEALAETALRLERAGADFLVICTNTMHKVAPAIEAKVRIPLLHIAEATANELIQNGVTRVGLLGTKYTMTQAFYRDKLTERGIEVLIPDSADVELVNRVIYEELCLGTISNASRAEFLRVIHALSEAGAQGVILGCTEIGLLVKQADTQVPLYDTTLIHARHAAELAIS